jgi:activator of HSP90 ATPase
MPMRHAVGIAAALVVALMPARANAQNATILAGPPIHQEADFTASPQRVYAALVSTKEFTAFSGMPASVTNAVGGAITLFEGHITGRNVELLPGKRVVQAWRTVDWPAGVYSIARFELTAKGTGTHLVFDQTGFPEAERASLAAGWESHYWAPLRKYRQ